MLKIMFNSLKSLVSLVYESIRRWVTKMFQFQMVFLLIFGVAAADAKFILSVESVEVQDTFGRVQEVQVYAERILRQISEETKTPRIRYLKPHVTFPNGKEALIGVESELSQKICERLAEDFLEEEKVEAEEAKAEEKEAEEKVEAEEAKTEEAKTEEKEAEEAEAVAKKVEAVEITSDWGFRELLNYRRGILSGTFIVLGSEGKYYEAEMGHGDKAIKTFVCSGPISPSRRNIFKPVVWR